MTLLEIMLYSTLYGCYSLWRNRGIGGVAMLWNVSSQKNFKKFPIVFMGVHLYNGLRNEDSFPDIFWTFQKI